MALSLVLVVCEGNRDKSRASEKILKNATTYKLFPRTVLFEAPKCCISSGSEYSSPTMVGPTSCKVSHSGCLAGARQRWKVLPLLPPLPAGPKSASGKGGGVGERP